MNCEKSQLCYQPVTTENYLSPAHTDHYAFKKIGTTTTTEFLFQHGRPKSLQQ